MKHEKDHEKRVVLMDLPSDNTMISSLALCEKEQMAVSSYFVDQDTDINATYGFEDEHQLYHALYKRNEHGKFVMSIGATSILDQPYLDDDDDDSQDSSDDDDTSHDNSDDDFDLTELDDDTNEGILDNFIVENLNTRLLLISCSQGILSFSSFSCYPLLRLFVYMYLSQLMRTFTNYLKCIVISS